MAERDVQSCSGYGMSGMTKTVGSDPVEAFGQRVLEVASDEFGCIQGHGFALGVALVGESHFVMFDGENARIVDGLSVYVSGQVAEDSIDVG